MQARACRRVPEDDVAFGAAGDEKGSSRCLDREEALDEVGVGGESGGAGLDLARWRREVPLPDRLVPAAGVEGGLGGQTAEAEAG